MGLALRWAQSICLLATILGCSSQSSAPFSDFKPAKIFYGHRFTAQPPEGLGLLVVATASRTISCADLDPNGDMEMLQIELSGHRDGEYLIRRDGFSHNSLELFLAEASHRLDGGFVYSFPHGKFSLSTGSLTSPPSDDPASLSGELEVYAPVKPYSTQACEGGSGEGSLCTCLSEDGETETCVQEGDRDCCSATSEEYEVIKLDIEAVYCPWLCHASSQSLFSEHCDAEVEPDGT